MENNNKNIVKEIKVNLRKLSQNNSKDEDHPMKSKEISQEEITLESIRKKAIDLIDDSIDLDKLEEVINKFK